MQVIPYVVDSRSNFEASLLVIETMFGWVSDSGSFLRALQTDDVAAGVMRIA